MSLFLLMIHDVTRDGCHMDTPTGRGGASAQFLETDIVDANQGSTAPSTPTSARRARDSAGEVRPALFLHTIPFQTTLQPGNNASPTSTYSESTETAFRLTDRSTLHAVFATPFTTPARKVVVRSDPSLLTCFDPADKELYDLWVTRR